MKKTLLVILALVMALTMVMGSVSAVSAANTILPTLAVSLTNAVGNSYGGGHVNITCTARMLQDLTGTQIGGVTVPATGGTATGRFIMTGSYGSSSGSQAWYAAGNVIYLSVGGGYSRTMAWVTVEITNSNPATDVKYLIACFDEYNGFGTQGVTPGDSYITKESSLFQFVNENLTSDGGEYGHVSINIP